MTNEPKNESERVMQASPVLLCSRKEKRACNLQCMRHITDESAGYVIFSQNRKKTEEVHVLV